MKKGFSLIELMVVIVIIGIIASFAIPQYLKAKKMAQAMTVIADFKAIHLAAVTCYAETGKYPPDYYPGGVPKELVPYLPADFTFDRRPYIDVRYDWENWVKDDGTPKHPYTGVLYGVSVTTKDLVLVKYIKGLYRSTFVYSLNDNYTFVMESISKD